MARRKSAMPPRGLWISTPILLLPDTNAVDKMIIARTAGFGKNPCTLSNASYALVCSCKARNVQLRIRHLLNLGYLLNVGADKWHRKLWVNSSKIKQILDSQAA